MFSKIKDIKRKIYLAKIAGIIIGVIFTMMLGMIIFQQYQIQEIKNTVEVLQNT